MSPVRGLRADPRRRSAAGGPPDGRASDGAQNAAHAAHHALKRRTVPCDVSSLALWQCEAAYDRLGCPAAFASTNL